MIDRREALGELGLAALATPALTTAAPADDPFAADRLMADVTRYAGFGIHRSGSPGDRASGQWIGERLRAAGFAVSTMPFEVPFFDSRSAELAVGELRITGFAQHPVTSTGPRGLTARLQMRYDPADDAALPGRIAVIPLPYGRYASAMSPAVLPLLIAAKRAKAAAVILVTTGPSALPIALNAAVDAPFAPLPILNIGSDQLPALIAHARAGDHATLVIDGDAGRRRAENVVGHRHGAGPTVVMTTPRSGWFTCAGERGSGLAAWLAMAAWLPHAFPTANLLFAAMSGHEFDNIGSKLFLETVAPAPAKVALWQHFGSGFATRDFHEAAPGKLTPLPSADAQRWLIASPPLLHTVQRAVRGLPGFERVYPGDASTAAGEATAILAAGYDRIIANFAAHRYFHTAADLPDGTTGDLIAAAARAMRQAVTEIVRNA